MRIQFGISRVMFVTLIAAAFACFLATFAKQFVTVKFDASLWKQGADSQSSPSRDQSRSKMIADLMNSSLLLGKKREEVLLLLGNPDGMDRKVTFPGWDLYYYVCPSGVDDRYLLIRFDANSRVSEVKVIVT